MKYIAFLESDYDDVTYLYAMVPNTKVTLAKKILKHCGTSEQTIFSKSGTNLLQVTSLNYRQRIW